MFKIVKYLLIIGICLGIFLFFGRTSFAEEWMGTIYSDMFPDPTCKIIKKTSSPITASTKVLPPNYRGGCLNELPELEKQLQNKATEMGYNALINVRIAHEYQRFVGQGNRMQPKTLMIIGTPAIIQCR